MNKEMEALGEKMSRMVSDIWEDASHRFSDDIPHHSLEHYKSEILRTLKRSRLVFVKQGEGIVLGTTCGRSTEDITEWWVEGEKGEKINPYEWQRGQVGYKEITEIEV